MAIACGLGREPLGGVPEHVLRWRRRDCREALLPVAEALCAPASVADPTLHRKEAELEARVRAFLERLEPPPPAAGWAGATIGAAAVQRLRMGK